VVEAAEPEVNPLAAPVVAVVRWLVVFMMPLRYRQPLL